MSILDTTIVNVALDTLGRDLHATLASVQWVTTGYLLSLSIVIPLTGWAIERFGAKRLWMTSVLVFLVGSALAGMAWNIQSLILFRVLQGFGGGMIMPVGQTILAQAAGPHRMGRVMSIIGVPMMLGPVLGPVLGGVLVQDISWRWIFYVNIPIGAAALVIAAKVLPRPSVPGHHRLDGVGLALLSPGLAILVYGLSEASSGGGFASGKALAPIVAGLALTAAFVAHSARRGPNALIDVKLFRDVPFSAGAATSFLFGVALFGAMILLPLYYQIVRGEGALATGLLLTPQGVGMALVMPISGRMTDRVGAGKIVPVGLAITLLGTLPYCLVGAHTPYGLLLGALFVRGFGMGFVMMPAMAAAYATLGRDAVPRATTALNIIQRIGGSVGTAFLAVMLERYMKAALPGAAGHAGAGFAALSSIPDAIRQQVAPPLAHAFGKTYWISLVLIAVVYIPGWFLPRRPPEFPPATPGRAVPAGHPEADPVVEMM